MTAPANPLLVQRLRAFVIVIAMLGAVTAVIAQLPGERVYDDEANCFGNGLVGIFTTEHHSTACTPSYTRLAVTRPAGGIPLALCLVIMLTPAFAVWRSPTRRAALRWIAWTVLSSLACSVAMFAVEFHLDIFMRTIEEWPQQAVFAMTAATIALLLVVLPLILATSKLPAIARARVVSS
jgi:hypothetical protein